MKKFLLLISLIFVSLFSVELSSLAENIRFVQVTDTHLSADSEFTQNLLKSTVDDINNQEGIAFVVFTGDNIDFPKEENLKAFLNSISKLKVPYYLALGNHDVYKSGELSKVKYFEILRSKNIFYRQRTPNYKFKKNGFVFIILDGAKEVIPGPAGYFKKNTLAWLDKTLTKNSKKSVVIFQHFPIEYPEGSEGRLKTHKTYKAEEYQAVLDKHDNVIAILSGHFHVNYEKMDKGVYHISTPSLLKLPYSYKIIDIVSSKGFAPIIYTQLKEVDYDKI